MHIGLHLDVPTLRASSVDSHLPLYRAPCQTGAVGTQRGPGKDCTWIVGMILAILACMSKKAWVCICCNPGGDQSGPDLKMIQPGRDSNRCNAGGNTRGLAQLTGIQPDGRAAHAGRVFLE